MFRREIHSSTMVQAPGGLFTREVECDCSIILVDYDLPGLARDWPQPDKNVYIALGAINHRDLSDS